VADELPDLDEEVSFVVDDGEPVGPLSMRQIIASIRNGQRNPAVLVWWADATEWVVFAEHKGLDALLAGLPTLDQPPPPKAEVELPTRATIFGTVDVPAEDEASESEVSAVAFEADVSGVADADADDDVILEVPAPVSVVAFQPYVQDPETEPLVDVEAVSAIDVDTELAETPVEADLADLSPADPSGVDTPALDDAPALDDGLVASDADTDTDADPHGDADPEVDADVVEAEAEAEAEAEEHPEVAVESADAQEALVPGTIAEVDQAQIDAYVAASGRDARPEEVSDVEDESFSGLFGASARAEAGLTGPASPPKMRPESLEAARDSLEAVGARIDALSAATRESSLIAALGGSSTASKPLGDSSNAAEDVATESSPESSGSAQEDSDHGDPLEPEPEVAEPLTLDQRFEQMVQNSATLQRRLEWRGRVDEVLLSACVTAISERGFMAMELASRQSDHRVAFDTADDSRRLLLEIIPLAPAVDATGRHVRVGLSWGRAVEDIGEAFSISRSVASDDPDAGIITTTVDATSETAYTAVDLVWVAEDFVSEDFTVNRSALDSSVAAAIHALEQRWQELFGAIEAP